MVRLGRQSHFVGPADEMGREMSHAGDALRTIWGSDKIRHSIEEVLKGPKVGSVAEIEFMCFQDFSCNLGIGDNYAC